MWWKLNFGSWRTTNSMIAISYECKLYSTATVSSCVVRRWLMNILSLIHITREHKRYLTHLDSGNDARNQVFHSLLHNICLSSSIHHHWTVANVGLPYFGSGCQIEHSFIDLLAAHLTFAPRRHFSSSKLWVSHSSDYVRARPQLGKQQQQQLKHWPWCDMQHDIINTPWHSPPVDWCASHRSTTQVHHVMTNEKHTKNISNPLRWTRAWLGHSATSTPAQ